MSEDIVTPTVTELRLQIEAIQADCSHRWTQGETDRPFLDLWKLEAGAAFTAMYGRVCLLCELQKTFVYAGVCARCGGTIHGRTLTPVDLLHDFNRAYAYENPWDYFSYFGFACPHCRFAIVWLEYDR